MCVCYKEIYFMNFYHVLMFIIYTQYEDIKNSDLCEGNLSNKVYVHINNKDLYFTGVHFSKIKGMIIQINVCQSVQVEFDDSYNYS